MSKIQDVPFITKVIDTLSDELKSGLYDLIDGQVKTPVFRSLVNNDYAITEANDKGKVQFVTLETLRGNYTGYLAYNSVYCVLIAFKGNTQALDMLNINVAKHTFAFVNESLSILELRVELEDGKEGVTPTDLGVTNNNIHLSKGTTQIGEGINFKTLDGKTLIGSGNVGFKTINDQEIVGDGNIVVGEGGTIAIDTAFDETSTNPVQNKVIAKFANEVVDNKANVDGNYPTMTVGNADNANNLIATKGLEVESYFTFEKTGGEQASAIETGNGTLKNLYGKTEKSENLLVLEDVPETTLNGVTYKVENGVLTLSGTATAFTRIDLVTDLSLKLSANSYTLVNLGDTWNWANGFYLGSSYSREDIQFNKYVATQTKTFTEDIEIKYVYITIANGVSISNKTIKPMLVKGSTAPTTWTQGYTGLKHTHITGVKSTGINQWDEEWEAGQINAGNGQNEPSSNQIRSKNYIPIIPNATYYCHFGGYTTNAYGLVCCFYDTNKNYIRTIYNITNNTFTTPANAYFMRFCNNADAIHLTTYNHDICINFSNPNINGNYYPYEQDTLDIEFEGNGVGTVFDEINVEEKKKYQRFGMVDLGDINWGYLENKSCWYGILPDADASGYYEATNIICDTYTPTGKKMLDNPENYPMSVTIVKATDIGLSGNAIIVYNGSDSVHPTGKLVYELAEPIVTDIEIPKDTIKVWNGGSMEALGTEVPVGTKIFYQKNIKAFVETLGEAIDWNPERIERLAKLSITPEYVNISLNPSQANAYAVAQVYNATFTIVISAALTGTPNGEITFQDSEIDLSSFETQPAESIYDMDGKKVSEEPTTEDCNIASFVGRSYNGIVLWSLLHSGVNKVKVHFEQAIPLDSDGNGKLDCRASLIL